MEQMKRAIHIEIVGHTNDVDDDDYNENSLSNELRVYITTWLEQAWMITRSL